MRQSEVIRTPGFDGRYGIIRLFTQEERNGIFQDKESSFPCRPTPEHELPNRQVRRLPRKTPVHPASPTTPVAGLKPESDLSIPAFFNPKQEAAIESNAAHVLVLAGPGTGKTHTLIGKINAPARWRRSRTIHSGGHIHTPGRRGNA